MSVVHIFRDRLDAYEDECEVWKRDHELAMLYFDCRDLLEEGVKLWMSICRLDENWRSGMYAGTSDYDSTMAEKIDDLFFRFARVSRQVADEILPWCKSKFGDVEHEKEFLACHREAQAIFAKEKDIVVDELSDEAIDLHRRGQTVEYDCV